MSVLVILSLSKDDTNEGLRVNDPIPLRQAQSDIMAESDSVAQSDISGFLSPFALFFSASAFLPMTNDQ